MITQFFPKQTKFIIVIFFLLCNGLLYSQEQGIELPNNFGFYIYSKSKTEVIKRLKDIEKFSPEQLTTTSKWTYHLTVSSCKLYLGKDSSLYHFYEAYKIKPKSTCGGMVVRHNAFIKALEEERVTGIEDPYIKQIKKETRKSIFSWYLWDLPDFDEFAFIDSCNKKYPPNIEGPIKIDSTKNSEIIRKRDQKYRDQGEKQSELDRMNRNFVDSLYLLKASLNSFTQEEIYQFSMVAHHSDDCDWVYKWVERFIEHYNNEYKGKSLSLLGPLLDRMLKAKEGYCTKQDAQRRDQFVNKMKDKYPKVVENMKLD